MTATYLVNDEITFQINDCRRSGTIIETNALTVDGEIVPLCDRPCLLVDVDGEGTWAVPARFIVNS